jgi:copper chaperone NosL
MHETGCSVLIVACVVHAMAGLVLVADDIKQFPSRKYCGMDREKFARSGTFVEYDYRKAEGFCGIHCAAVDLALHIDRSPLRISVGYYATKELIDAEKAFWVIGGGKPGVMTKRAKWAFKTQEDVDAFVRGNGGSIATFDDAMKATYEDMYQDSKMIRERRALMKKKSMEQKLPAGPIAK